MPRPPAPKVSENFSASSENVIKQLNNIQNDKPKLPC